MFSRIWIMILAIVLLLQNLVGPSEFAIGPELSAEAEQMEWAFSVRDTVQHDSLEELLARCATDTIREAMRGFAAGQFEPLCFFTTFYLYDDDRNFPTSVISFEADGMVYYFSGAERYNPFADYSDSRTYGGNGVATVMLQWDESSITTCSLQYDRYPDEFAISPVSPVEQARYYEVLTQVTGAAFRCISNDIVTVSGNSVAVVYFSYEMSEPRYTLSDENILLESSCYFEPSVEEFVNYSDDPDAPGGAMVESPAMLGVEFEVVGIGRVVLDIFGDDEQVLYSVEIEATQDGVFLANEPF